MNNEEKILSMLEQLCGDVSGLKGDVSELKERMTSIEDRVTAVELTQENVIVPQINALAEGQKTILETLAPKNRVEALEDEMDFMKTVVRALSRDVSELKKAQ